jgi:hypothetical protein
LTIVLVLADYSRYAQVRSCGRIDAQPSHSSERRVTASGDVDNVENAGQSFEKSGWSGTLLGGAAGESGTLACR